MSSTQADRLLQRITALHKSLHLEAGGQVSRMERDLMLNYLRDLYEIYAEDSPARPAPPKPRQVSTPPDPPTTYDTDAPASVTAPPSVSVQPDPPREPVRETPPVVPPVPEVTVPPPPPPAMTTRTAVVEPVTQPTEPSPAPAPNVSGTISQPTEEADLDVLFADDGATGRFGRQPISDLTRALSINNRILFTKDLFGGDNGLLNATLRQLNAFDSVAEARPLLTTLARRFEWLEDEKRESAREFIELVRRRYV